MSNEYIGPVGKERLFPTRRENAMTNEPADQQGEWRVVTSLGLPAVVAPGGIKYHLESISDVHDLMARITALETENARLKQELADTQRAIGFIIDKGSDAAQVAIQNARLETENARLCEVAALVDEAKALMDGWRTPFVIGDGSMDAEAEYEQGTRRLVTDTRDWLARYARLSSTGGEAS